MTDESVKDVEKFVMKDMRVLLRHIASEMSISVEIILHDRFNLFKTSTRRVPRLRAVEQKIMCQQASQELLKALKQALRIF